MSTIGSRATRVLCLLLLIAATASGCGDGSAANDGGDGGVNNNDPSSPAGSSGGGSSGASGGSCKESALFSPRSFGEDGRRVIGAVRPDLATGDLYFSTGQELYVVPKGASEPKLVAERPEDIWSDFWLTDDGFLFPSGFQVPLVDTEIAVLFAMPRSGGEPTVQVAAPVSSTEDGWDYHIQDVAVSGDEVYWVAIDAFTAEPWRTPPQYDRTYYVRKTNWRTPGAPVELYSSKHELSGLLIAAGKVYVDDAIDDTIGSDTVQRIVALDGSGAEAMTAQERFAGGEVVAGDDESLIITRSDSEDFAKFGSFRIAPDGTGEEKLDNVYLLAFGGVGAASRDGKWVFLHADGLDRSQLLEYEVGKGLHEIGCIEADFRGGLVIGDGEALIGIKHDDTGSTVLRFGL